MRTALVTAPAADPVSLAEVKTHLRVTGTDDDALITRLYAVAVASVEQTLCRKLITQTWKAYFDAWPDNQFIIPFGNLQSVTHIKYTDVDATQSTFSSSYCDVDTVSVPGRILLGYGDAWPTDTLTAVNPIEIQFVTGYGASSTNVPQDIRNAIMLLVGHYYENREMYLIGTIGNKIPMSVEFLLNPHRVWEWCL